MTQATLRHPKGSAATVLLTSVFGPYAQDDEFGSRSINPMELYHNQVTREQGPFSLRMFHRSWGLMMIQQNIESPSTLLDFPTREAFARELKENRYDIVGISSIIINVGKVREMCRMVRELSPHSTIIVGGHVTSIPALDRIVDADIVVKGEGIAWMRAYLGQDANAPIKHPDIQSGFGFRVMGIRPPRPEPSATIIPSVGCPLGCNFCTTSAFFGGKGKFKNFIESGEQLFEVMRQVGDRLQARKFFIMDENFLLHKQRAMDLLARMKAAKKSWELYVFSSANAIRKYKMEELVELGVSWIWLGLESVKSKYAKLSGIDTLELVKELRSHGIKTLGSTIVGLEHHTPENLPEDIEHAVAHGTDFHQFMLYTPLPGTPLFKEMDEQGRMLDVDLADVHGQWKFNFEHAAISRDQSKEFLDAAFRRDFEANGPSLYRIIRTTFEGWKRYKDYPDERVRERFAREAAALKGIYAAALWAIERQMRKSNEAMGAAVRQFRQDLQHEFGGLTRIKSALVGPMLLWTLRREARRLSAGVTYEPETIIERRNWDQPLVSN